MCCVAGVNHWLKYVTIAKGAEAPAFPVAVADLLGWSMLFRCLGTFGNYLSHVRGACCALGHEPPPVGHPALKRAMGAVAKRALFSPRTVPSPTQVTRLSACILWQAAAGNTADHAEEHDRKGWRATAWRLMACGVFMAAASPIRGQISFLSRASWLLPPSECNCRRYHFAFATMNLQMACSSQQSGGRAPRCV